MQTNSNFNFTPYNFLNLQNILLVFSFFSPFIIIFFFTFIGIYFSPLTGIIFLFTISLTILFRKFLYKYFSSLNDLSAHSCNLINYSNIGTGDIYLSLWVFSFTLFYIIVPLINNNGINYSLVVFLSIFVILFLIDFVIKAYNGCYSLSDKKPFNILFNIFIGSILGLLLSLAFSTNNSLNKHLFFTSNSTNETCKQVNDTKFQCSFDFE